MDHLTSELTELVIYLHFYRKVIMVRPFSSSADESGLLWPLFELVNLENLCFIAQKPRFRQSVGEYFRTHFRGKSIYLSEHDRPTDDYFTHFGRSIQQISIRGLDVGTFDYVASNFPHLAKITFEDGPHPCTNLPIEWADILSNQMRMVSTVVFNFTMAGQGPFYDRLLEHARQNIRILIINVPDANHWCSQLYPNLNIVQWDDGIISNPRGFKRLLVLNPNIQHLIFTRQISMVMDFITNNNIELHRLDVKIALSDLPHIETICRRLNRLFEIGHFKQLFVAFDRDLRIFNHHLNTLKGLTGIVYNGEYVPAIGECAQLTELTMDSMDDAGGRNAANHLTALRTLRIKRASIDAIAPFICEAPQIMKIVLKETDIDTLDVDKFQYFATQRGRLPIVQQLRIYVEERAYCMLKPYETPSVYIGRIEELLN